MPDDAMRSAKYVIQLANCVTQAEIGAMTFVLLNQRDNSRTDRLKMILKSFIVITICTMISNPKISFGQTEPDLGGASDFALFTASGAFDNLGPTVVTGDIGSHTTAVTGFPPGTVTGTIYESDATTAQAALDVAAAYTALNQGGSVIGVELGGQTLTTGVYQTGAASILNGNLTLDAQGDPTAVFIIRIGGAFSTGSHSTVTLVNSASICHVYWQVDGQFTLGDSSVFRGTALVNGALQLLPGSSVMGRVLVTAGAVSVSLYGNVVNPSITIEPFSPASSTRCQSAGSITVSTTAVNNGDPVVYSLDAPSVSGGNTIDSSTGTVVFDPGWSGTTVITGSVYGCDGPVTTTNTVTVNPLPISSLIHHF